MAEHRNPLSTSERQAITRSLTELHTRLKEAGQLLAALHIGHALQCLDPEHPINHQAAHQGKNPA